MPWKTSMFVPSVVFCPHCGARNNPTATSCGTCHRSPDEKAGELPDQTPPKQNAPDPYTASHTLLGADRQNGHDVNIPDISRYSGMYILGKQGMGKSSLLEWLIFQDIAKGNAVFVIDPHGDLVEKVIAQMPEKKLSKAYLLDMEDETYPFGVNVFTGRKTTGTIAQTQAVDRVMHVFEVIWGDILSQRDLPRYLRLATLVLLANPGTTLLDMYYFLRDDDDTLRERMLRNVKDPDITYFWRQYQGKTPSARKKEIEPLFNRLEGLFLGRTLVKNIVGQSDTSIDFRAAIENREIILIKLPRKILPQDAALIGTMLTTQIHAAIFSFSDMPAEKRPGFSLYVDEFEHFATPDFAEMFSEGRKFGVRLCLAHQTRSQIPRALETLRSTTYNAATVICFSAPDDASEMARLFPGKAEVRHEDIDPDPVNFLLTYSHDAPVMNRFTRVWLQPEHDFLPRLKHQRVQEDKYGKQNVYTTSAAYEAKKQEIYQLSRFLYEVEKSGNWQQPIPMYVTKLFGGYYTELRWIPDQAKDYLKTLDLTDPAQLAKARQYINSLPVDEKAMLKFYKDTAPVGYSGWGWNKTEYNEAVALLPRHRENFLTLLTDFRNVMCYLAINPIGKLTAPSAGQVATQIINLKQRQALVKTTQSTYQMQTINTNDTQYIPRTAQAAEQQARKRAILEQTHTKYCKKDAEVAQEIQRRLGVLSSDDEAGMDIKSEGASERDLTESATMHQAEKQEAHSPASLDVMNALFTHLRAREIDPGTTILAALGEHYVMTIKQWMRLFEWGSYPRATQYFKDLREEGMIYRRDREGRGGNLVEGDWFFLLTRGANELVRRKQPEPLFTLEPNEAEKSSGDTLVHTYLLNDILIHLRLLEREQSELVRIEHIDHERSMRRAYLSALADSKLYPDGFMRLLVPTPNGLKRRSTFLELQHTTQRDEANWKAKCRKYLAFFEQEVVLETFFATRTPQLLILTIDPNFVSYHQKWTEEVLLEQGGKGRAYSNRFIIGSYDTGISDMSVTPRQFFCSPRFFTPFQTAPRPLFGT